VLTRDVLLQLRGASAQAFRHRGAIIGFIVGVVGPCLLLATGGRDPNRVPWYVWITVPLLLLSVMSIGFLMFNRRDRSKDMSINPRNR